MQLHRHRKRCSSRRRSAAATSAPCQHPPFPRRLTTLPLAPLDNTRGFTVVPVNPVLFRVNAGQRLGIVFSTQGQEVVLDKVGVFTVNGANAITQAVMEVRQRRCGRGGPAASRGPTALAADGRPGQLTCGRASRCTAAPAADFRGVPARRSRESHQHQINPLPGAPAVLPGAGRFLRAMPAHAWAPGR